MSSNSRDLISLVEKLRQEQEFVAFYKSQIRQSVQELNSCCDSVFHSLWLSHTLSYGLNRVLATHLRCLEWSLGCSQAKNVEFVNASKALKSTFLVERYTHFLTSLLSDPSVLAEVLHWAEGEGLDCNWLVNDLMSVVYGHCVFQHDHQLFLKLLQELLRAHVRRCETPKDLFSGVESVFNRALTEYCGQLVELRTFITEALQEPLMQVLLCEDYLEYDVNKAGSRFQANANQNGLLVDTSTFLFSEDLESSCEQLARLSMLFLESLHKLMNQFPVSLKWLLGSLKVMVKEKWPAISRSELRRPVSDAVFGSILSLAIVNPDSFGIIDSTIIITPVRRYNLTQITSVLQGCAWILDKPTSSKYPIHKVVKRMNVNLFYVLMDNIEGGYCSDLPELPSSLPGLRRSAYITSQAQLNNLVGLMKSMHAAAAPDLAGEGDDRSPAVRGRISQLVSHVLPAMKDLATSVPYCIQSSTLVVPKPHSSTPNKKDSDSKLKKRGSGEAAAGKSGTNPRKKSSATDGKMSPTPILRSKTVSLGAVSSPDSKSNKQQQQQLSAAVQKQLNHSPSCDALQMQLNFQLPEEVLILPLYEQPAESVGQQHKPFLWDFDLLAEEEFMGQKDPTYCRLDHSLTLTSDPTTPAAPADTPPPPTLTNGFPALPNHVVPSQDNASSSSRSPPKLPPISPGAPLRDVAFPPLPPTPHSPLTRLPFHRKSSQRGGTGSDSSPPSLTRNYTPPASGQSPVKSSPFLLKDSPPVISRSLRDAGLGLVLSPSSDSRAVLTTSSPAAVAAAAAVIGGPSPSCPIDCSKSRAGVVQSPVKASATSASPHTPSPLTPSPHTPSPLTPSPATPPLMTVSFETSHETPPPPQLLIEEEEEEDFDHLAPIPTANDASSVDSRGSLQNLFVDEGSPLEESGTTAAHGEAVSPSSKKKGFKAFKKIREKWKRRKAMNNEAPQTDVSSSAIRKSRSKSELAPKSSLIAPAKPRSQSEDPDAVLGGARRLISRTYTNPITAKYAALDAKRKADEKRSSAVSSVRDSVFSSPRREGESPPANYDATPPAEMSPRTFRKSLYCEQLEYKLRTALQNIHTPLSLSPVYLQLCADEDAMCDARYQLLVLLQSALQRSRWRHDAMEVALLSETIRMIEPLSNRLVQEAVEGVHTGYHKRAAYISYLVKSHQKFQDAQLQVAAVQDAVNRMELILEEQFVHHTVKLFLEWQEVGLERFSRQLQGLYLADERVALMRQHLGLFADTLQEDPTWSCWAEMEQVYCCLEDHLFASVYEHVFHPNGDTDTLRDQIFVEHLSKLSDTITASDKSIQIPFVYHSGSPWCSAQKHLTDIAVFKSPRGKLRCIVQSCKILISLLQYAKCGEPPGADDLFPVLVYLLIKANPPSLLSTVQYIRNFAEEQLVGEDAYWWAQFSTAVEFTKTLE